jgi:hypothetical protein
MLLAGADVLAVAGLTLALLRPAGQQVALERAAELELAGGGLLEPLLGTGVRLDLGHGSDPRKIHPDWAEAGLCPNRPCLTSPLWTEKPGSTPPPHQTATAAVTVTA